MAIASREQEVVERVQKGLYIGGEWREATGGATLPVEDPATGDTLCEVADATPEDAKVRSFDIDTRNTLNPVPGLDGVLR